MARRGRGEGLIHKREDGRWEARVDLGVQNGKRQRKSIYGKTRQEVAAKLKTALYDRDQGLLRAGPSQKLGPFLEGWLESVRSKLAPKTYVAYEMYLRRHIIPELGTLGLDKLGPEQVQRLLDRKLAEGTGVHDRARNAAGAMERDALVQAVPPESETAGDAVS